jgi:hypothetical protein
MKKKKRIDNFGNMIEKDMEHHICFDNDVTVCIFDIDEEVIRV